MKIWLRRTGIIIVVTLTLGLALASQVVPAQAASTIYVDDDGADCATTTHTIHDGIAEAMTMWPWTGDMRIVVCAGHYAEPPLVVAGVSGLKLVAKKHVTVVSDGSKATSQISVVNSTGVLVSGFTIDGESVLPGGTMTKRAIEFVSSTGTIRQNRVVNWHTPGYTDNPNIQAIAATGSAGESVDISSNTISDYQHTAVYVGGFVTVFVGSNLISGANQPFGIRVEALTGAPAGTIAKNSLTASGSPMNASAIRVFEGSFMVIDGNVVYGWHTGVFVTTGCSVVPDASHNTITNNRVSEAVVGIAITAAPVGSCDAHADFNLIKNNRIFNSTLLGTYGIHIAAADPEPTPPTAFAQFNSVTNNSITHFTFPEHAVAVGYADITGTTFSGDHIYP